MLPDLHREFLERAVALLATDSAVAGVAAGGSYITSEIDDYSDLDLVVAVADGNRGIDRRAIAESLGPLLSAFTGEHVGEPRLLICLYGPPLLHVDLKFVTLAELAERVEDPVVLFERDGAMTAAFANSEAKPPQIDLEWLRERFWIWIHNAVIKAERGEILECLDMVGFIRQRLLGPIALTASGETGLRAQGLRRIEVLAPEWAPRLANTIGSYDAASCLEAIATCCDVYEELRIAVGLEAQVATATEVRRYLEAARTRFTSSR